MKGFVLVKGKGGLGNRMQSAMSGILYAMLSDRQIVIDWSDFTYSNQGENALPKLFTVPNSKEHLPESARCSVAPLLWVDQLDRQASEVVQEVDPIAHNTWRGYRKFSFDFSSLDHPEQTLVMWTYSHLIPRMRRHFRGPFSWLSSMTDEDIMRWLLNNRLILHPDIMATVERQWRLKVSQDNVVGVHIRFTDLKLSIEPYYNVLDNLFKTVPNLEMFLATDNISVQKNMIKRYYRVVYNDKWFPAGGQAMHHNNACPDRTQNAIDALLDMYMLAKCSYLIYAGSSTFSYLSSLLSTSPTHHIIDTERRKPLIQMKKTIKRWVT